MPSLKRIIAGVFIGAILGFLVSRWIQSKAIASIGPDIDLIVDIVFTALGAGGGAYGARESKQ
jgi:uncharacterized protein YacL